MPENESDITNNSLSKLFSVEILGAAFVFVFGLGVTYTTLAEGQTKADERIQKIETEQTAIKSAVHSIQTDTAVLRTEQSHMREETKELKQDVRRILTILENRKNN